jgi:hypothetical protein
LINNFFKKNIGWVLMLLIFLKCCDVSFYYIGIDLVRLSNSSLMWTKKTKVHGESSWIPPPQGTLKWSINPSTNSKPRPLRIVSVSRDHEWEFICIFSYYTGIKKSNEA